MARIVQDLVAEARGRIEEIAPDQLAAQDDNAELKETFGPVAEALAAKEESIAQTLLDVQGEPADLGGYFLPDDEKANAVMRPSAEFNEIIDGLRK